MKAHRWSAAFGVRRTLTALAIGAALWFTIGPLTGIAIADDDTTVPMPQAWNGAKPLSGDGGSYAVGAPNASDTAAFEFRWFGPLRGLGADGEFATISELHVAAPSAFESATPAYDVFRVDEQGMVLAAGQETHMQATQPCDDVAVACTGHVRKYTRTLNHSEDATGAIPCGLSNSLQRGPLFIGDEFRFAAPCDGTPRELTARVSEVTRDAEGRLQIRILASRIGSLQPTASFLFREDIPYPLEIDLDATIDGPALRLTTFNRGSEPAPTVEFPYSVSWTMTERGKYGPSEVGLDHQFPLSQAIDGPTNGEPALKLFLLQHPTAYAAQAHHRYAGSEAESNHTWRIILTDGTANFAFEVTRATAAAGVHYSMTPLPSPTERFPAPTLLPTKMPTASELQRRWAAYVGFGEPRTPDLPGGLPVGKTVLSGVGYGIDASCANIDCSQAHVEYHACHNFDLRRSNVEPGSAAVRQDRYEMQCTLVFDETGQPIFSTEQNVQTMIARGGAPLAAPAAQRGGTPVTFTSAGAPATAIAVGAGILSIAAAFLYWIWPLVRHALGLGFFTRIQRENVLENPTRQDILALIEAEPGVHVRELQRRLGYAHGTVLHHLRTLQRNKLVVTSRAGGRTCYFAAATKPTDRNRALLGSEQRLGLLRAVAERPHVGPSELARILGVRRQSVHESTKRLLRDGLIDIATKRHGRAITLTELGRQTLALTN